MLDAYQICLERSITGAEARIFAGSLPCRKSLTLQNLNRAFATYPSPQIVVAMFAKLRFRYLLDNRVLDIYSRIRGSSRTQKLQGKYENTNQSKFLTYRTHHPQRFKVPLLFCEFFKGRKPQKIVKSS